MEITGVIEYLENLALSSDVNIIFTQHRYHQESMVKVYRYTLSHSVDFVLFWSLGCNCAT